MDATQYFAMARRWWWLLIVGTVIAVGAYGIAVRVRDNRQGAQVPTYSASATFFVSAAQAPAASGQPQAAATDNASLDRLTQSYAQIIKGPGVADRIVSTLGLQQTTADVQSRISVETPPLTQLIKVTTKGASAGDAQALIDGVMQAFVGLRQEGNLPGSVSVVEVDRAQAVTVSPVDSLRGQMPTVVLVAAFGMLGAAAIVVAFEYLTDSVRDRVDAERASGLPVLASVPAWNIGRNAKRALAMINGSTSAVAERYRMLRTAIGIATEGRQAQVLLIAGGMRGVGATTTAANVATALAQTGRRVALMDADMREPSLHKVFSAEDGIGLSELLGINGMTLDGVLRPTAAEHLTLITAGTPVTNASELLESPRFDAMMRALRERFDAVVIDAPPALQVTDAAVLAGKCDATMIVARGDVTRRKELVGTIEMLRPSAKQMIGLVLNADANVPGGGFFGFRVSEPTRRRETVRA